MFDYTPREWNFLIQPGEFEWQDEWTSLREDTSYWKPRVESICERHDIRSDIAITFEAGTDPVCLIGEVAIKLFVRRNPIWFSREHEALRILSTRTECLSPQLVAWGEETLGDPEHPYIVMRRLSGKNYFNFRNKVSQADEEKLIAQLGITTRAIHETPIDALGPKFGRTSEEWVARVHARAEFVTEHYSDGLAPHLLKDVDQYIADHIHLIDHQFEPTLLHADLVAGNILSTGSDGDATLSGIIDYGDVEIGPIEYEWVSLFTKALLSDHRKMAVFAESYGMAYPFSSEQRERLKLYTLLHRFSVIPHTPELQHSSATLDEFLSKLWD